MLLKKFYYDVLTTLLVDLLNEKTLNSRPMTFYSDELH